MFRLLDTWQMPNAAVAGATDRLDVIRPPLAARAYVIVFMCVWCGTVLAD
jgi:hypothetical protein